jgi:hypothetical protein
MCLGAATRRCRSVALARKAAFERAPLLRRLLRRNRLARHVVVR